MRMFCVLGEGCEKQRCDDDVSTGLRLASVTNEEVMNFTKSYTATPLMAA